MKGLSVSVQLSILSAICLAGCSAWPFPTPTPTPTRTPAPTFRLPPSPTRWVYLTDTPQPTRTPIPTKTLTPTPPPLPPFTGRLLLDLESELYWLTGTGGIATLSEPLAREVREMAVSPDGRYLVFSGLKDNITLMDLATGKKQAVAASTSDCTSWSPQSTRFTYTVFKPSPALYMYDLASKSSVRITDFPCSSYMGAGLGSGAGSGGLGTGTFCGEVTCGAWMDESHLLFQRFTGQMPEKITRFGASTPIELRAQLTTMATFGKAAGQRPKLVDWPERLYEVERCDAGPYVLLRKALDGDDLYISSVFTDTAGVQPRPVPQCKYAAECGTPYFVDAQCNLLTSHESLGTSKDYVTLTDPQTLEEVFRSPQLPTEYRRPDGTWVHDHWSWHGNDVWVGDPQEWIIALAVGGPKNSQVILLNLSTGGKSVLLDSEAINSKVLAWLAP